MARLEVDGKKSIYYEDLGGDGRAMVLIHGWGMDNRCWDGVILPLQAAGHRVITIDHRGCGRSDHDFADLSIAAIAGDVADLVAHLGLSDVVSTVGLWAEPWQPMPPACWGIDAPGWY